MRTEIDPRPRPPSPPGGRSWRNVRADTTNVKVRVRPLLQRSAAAVVSKLSVQFNHSDGRERKGSIKRKLEIYREGMGRGLWFSKLPLFFQYNP